MCLGSVKKRPKVFVSERVHPQTIDLVLTRMAPLGVTTVVGNAEDIDLNSGACPTPLLRFFVCPSLTSMF